MKKNERGMLRNGSKRLFRELYWENWMATIAEKRKCTGKKERKVRNNIKTPKNTKKLENSCAEPDLQKKTNNSLREIFRAIGIR